MLIFRYERENDVFLSFPVMFVAIAQLTNQHPEDQTRRSDLVILVWAHTLTLYNPCLCVCVWEQKDFHPTLKWTHTVMVWLFVAR